MYVPGCERLGSAPPNRAERLDQLSLHSLIPQPILHRAAISTTQRATLLKEMRETKRRTAFGVAQARENKHVNVHTPFRKK
jgi:hypothetical protein